MENTKGEELKKELFNIKKTGWNNVSESQMEEIQKFADEYMYFLNVGKTEREVIENTESILRKNGFSNIEEKERLEPGDRVYYVNRGKSIYIAVIGKEKVENGLNIVGAHVDSPRLDLKPNPLYEDGGFALLKTHYYGGIKKYQWTTIPLAIHGVIVKEETSESIKLNILKILNEKYGIKEIDFLSSELEIVPAFKARTLGFDRSMVAAYGQDDKICAYTSLRAILDVYNPEKTAVCILSDKEEI